MKSSKDFLVKTVINPIYKIKNELLKYIYLYIHESK